MINEKIKEKVKLSVCIIVYNEEIIKRCLESFYDIVNEIIVVHDGPCKDNTLKIAAKYTKKIYIRPRIGGCEGHYEFTREKVKNEWFMFIDADEYFSKELRENIGKLILDKNVDAYEILWPTFCNGKELILGFKKKQYKRVLFRKNTVSFKGLLHEKRVVNGVVKNADYPLIHKPSADMFSKEYIEKKVKWADVAATMFAKKQKLKSARYYFLKAPLWFVLYVLYLMIIKMYFISGILGIRYALMYARYQFRFNMNLYKIIKYGDL
ncbi:MAG: glycosyltransferase [Candidatus Woesearchaeota archaeon]|jgi:glycosyltransferase involved in cell wall biosynthesis